ASERERVWAASEAAALYLDAGRHVEALALARRTLPRAGRLGDALAEYRTGRTLAFALDAAGERPAARDVLRRVARQGEHLRRDRLIASSAAPSRGSDDDPTGRGIADEAQQTSGRLLSMLLDEIEAEGARGDAEQSRLREVRDLLESQRSAELEDHFGDACLARQATTAPDDVAGALVLYPILLEDRVALLTGFEGRFTYHRAPATTDAVLDHARAFRRLLEKRSTRQYLRPAQHLYDAMIRPIEAQLEAPEVETLVVVPDGLLRTIPFAALHDRKRQRYLVDVKPTALVPSLRLTQPSPLARESLTVLAAGLETATAGFARLDYTRQEIADLRARFPGTRVLWDDAFDPDALAEEIRTRPYSVVHVATHGRVAADGRESFLLTRDGRLGLDEVTSMIQTTRFRRDRPLELLTLSACETAAGDETAALGLAGVALRAGARSALATLWPVNDEATARLIDAFYEELTRPDQTRAGALRVAQRRIRASPRFSHPGYWAPFLMISSWL
ncbi:MAG: CHAT domain-containing protein, partial [Myxococcota bacterium]